MWSAAQPVAQVSGITADTIDSALLNSATPLHLPGFAANWPAVQAARAGDDAIQDYLLSHYSGEPLTAYVSDAQSAGRVFYNADFSGFNFQPVRRPLSQLWTPSAGAEHWYVGSTFVPRWFPALLDAHCIPELTALQPLVSLWMGNQSTVAAHADLPQNIAVVLGGRRRFTLFPPEQLANLYIGPLELTPAGQAISLVDFNQPDFVQFPRFAQAMAQAQVAELAAGDALIIPSMWWHHVQALSSFNVLLNYWWRSSAAYLPSPQLALKLAMLSIGSLPAEQKAAWQAQFVHYVFGNDAAEHIPAAVRGLQGPINETLARQVRAELLNKLNR